MSEPRQLYEMVCDPTHAHPHPSGSCFAPVRAVAPAGAPEAMPEDELGWRRYQMEHNWPRNQYGSLLTQGEYDALRAVRPTPRAALTVETLVALLKEWGISAAWKDRDYAACAEWLLPRLGAAFPAAAPQEESE